MDAPWQRLVFSAFLLLALQSLTASGQLVRPSECDEGGPFKPVLICYFGTVNAMYPGNFSIRDFDSETCTHLVYSFATVDQESSTVKYPDSYADVRIALKLKKIENPCLKIILAVGGADTSKMFSDVVHNETLTGYLAASIAAEVAYTPWDGVDIDWEYPGPNDEANFTRFMQVLQCELRCAVCASDERRSFEVSIALSGSPFMIDQGGYEFEELNKCVNYYNIMAYDYHMYGPQDRYQKHQAPVYRHHTDNLGSEWDKLNALDSIKTLKCKGAQTNKLVLGFPTYGRIWEMQFPWSHQYGHAASGRGPAGSLFGIPGVWAISEFCLNLTTSKNKWTHVFDYEIMAPYAYTADNLVETYWFNYDNEITIIEKTDLAVGDDRRYPLLCNTGDPPEDLLANRLAGLMIWTLEYDDCNNVCEGWVACPLISAARKRLSFWADKYRADHDATSTTTTTTTTSTTTTPKPPVSDICKDFAQFDCSICKKQVLAPPVCVDYSV